MTNGGHDATKADDNPLWIYSVKQYGHASCAQFLLQAQDEYQLDINILLYIGWLATQKLGLNMQALIDSDVNHWQKEVVSALRKIRRQVKLLHKDDFYQQMLKLELMAEQEELQQLFELTARMEKNEQGFAQTVRGSSMEYFREINHTLQESWLQTLIQYLQPNSGIKS